MSAVTDRLIKNARNSLPGSIDAAIQLELFNAMDQFFRESSIWTEDVPFSVLSTDPAGTMYYIDPVSNAAIVRLIAVVDHNAFVQPALMQIPGEVTLVRPPGQSDTYIATVILSVIDPVLGTGYPDFPDWVLTKYGTGILSGVLGRMMAQPAKPYTNAELAKAHLAGLRRAISIARAEALHRNVQNGQAWAFPQQFSTRHRR